MTNDEAVQALRELREARPALDPEEVVRRATMILDRSTLCPLDLTTYLAVDRGLEGVALARTVGRFATRVAELYESKHGARPLKRYEFVPGVGMRPVSAYVEDDRPLFDRAWREITGDWDALGTKIDALCVNEETMLRAVS